MAEIGRWNGHLFEVSPSVVRGFTGMQIKGSSETEDKTKSKQKYVARKNGKPAEVNFTINLNSALGCDVRNEAIAFITEAEAGKKDYFYVGNSKLLTCKLMLVDASIKEIDIGSGSVWRKADVQVTMKQCSKFGALDSDGSKKKSKKKSVKKSSKKKTKNTGNKGGSSKNEINIMKRKDPEAFASRVRKENTGIKKAIQQAKRNTLAAKKNKSKNVSVKK